MGQRGMKVLVVDDSHVMRQMQVRCFHELGITDVVEAADGHIALQMFQTHAFDFIMTDWNMPVMSGLELLRAVRHQNTDVPVLMVTTEANRGSVVAAIMSGVTDYLVKPFQKHDLAAKIYRWCLQSDSRQGI